MKPFSLLAIVFLLGHFSLRAQETGMISPVLRTYAAGPARIAGGTYDSSKKYVVFKFHNPKETLDQTEKEELEYLKKFLPRLDVEVVELEWKTTEEIQKALKPYNITVSTTGEGLSLKAENFSMHSSSQKLLLVIEDGKPLSICPGKFCETNIKQFFKLQTVN